MTDRLLQNAEIAVGTIKDLETATTWLKGTFLYARLRRNPAHYRLLESQNGLSPDDMVTKICSKYIALLQDYILVTKHHLFKATDLGDAMSRYYVYFETMKLLVCLPKASRTSEMVSIQSRAHGRNY